MAFNRRDFLNMAAMAGAVAPLAQAAQAQAQTRSAAPAANTADGDVAWIDGAAPVGHDGQTFGLPWPRGEHRPGATFALSNGAPMQTWPTAYWPDGSLKWTAHAIPAGAGLTEKLWVRPGSSVPPTATVSLRETPAAIEVTSGAQVWKIGRKGANVITSATVGGRETLRDVRLVLLTQNQPDFEGKPVAQAEFISDITATKVEQAGPIRAVVKVDGKHRRGNRAWLPFSLRLYFYAGSQSVKVMHSFIFDGDENKDFICGLGLKGTAPFTDTPQDRHVRFAGENDGVFAEAVRPITGISRPGSPADREAQLAGRKTTPESQLPAETLARWAVVPAWGDFTLSQPNADGFNIRKRTKPGHGWIDIVGGRRASGVGYVGGASGGVAFAMSHFWRRPPTRLDIRNAHTNAGEFTVWLWSPDAPPMDIRFYHDSMGMDTYAKQNIGLSATYEDFEPGWGRPYGIARTNEITLWALPETPANAQIAQWAAATLTPPRLIATPTRVHGRGVFADWTLIDRSTPTRKLIEDQNDYYLKYYMDQVEQRRWYGFWNHGDVMHSADTDRRVWRYDIGGYAWANSELSPDLWLWYSFLRTGRADVFRFAEAMTRHTGEVDVCHIGPYRGFGTRHGVQHWGDSSKQPRVSTAAYRRIYYYLTADERVGDLMHDLIDSDQTLKTVFIERKVASEGGSGIGVRPRPPGTVDCGFGTSWSNFVTAWMTEWERTGDTRWRDRIVNGMDTIAALKNGWFCAGAPYDLATSKFVGPGDYVDFVHLNSVFGAVETHAEVLRLIDHPSYKAAWLDYCVYYNAPDEMMRAKFGRVPGGRSLRQGHSRLTAYAAHEMKDAKLAERAWGEYFSEGRLNAPQANQRLSGPEVFAPVDWNPGVSTNNTSQWALASFQNLAWAPEPLERVFTTLPPPTPRGPGSPGGGRQGAGAAGPGQARPAARPPG